MTQNPCVAVTEEYFVDRNKVNMRRISDVADVTFEPSLTSPKYTGTFADGQRISFDPNTVDWDNLKRTCIFWSERYFRNAYATVVAQGYTKSYADFKEELINIKRRFTEKLRLNEKYGSFLRSKDSNLGPKIPK